MREMSAPFVPDVGGGNKDRLCCRQPLIVIMEMSASAQQHEYRH